MPTRGAKRPQQKNPESILALLEAAGRVNEEPEGPKHNVGEKSQR